jgi:hypothetical protein
MALQKWRLKARQVTRPVHGSAGLIAGYETPDARPAGTEKLLTF